MRTPRCVSTFRTPSRASFACRNMYLIASIALPSDLAAKYHDWLSCGWIVLQGCNGRLSSFLPLQVGGSQVTGHPYFLPIVSGSFDRHNPGMYGNTPWSKGRKVR